MCRPDSLKKVRKLEHEDDFKDWRSLYKPLQACEDTEEHFELARGKEIKRGKDETRGVCFQYINEFTKESKDPLIRQELQEEFQKETFWQRVGLKKVDREIPLYSLGKDKLKETRVNL